MTTYTYNSLSDQFDDKAQLKQFLDALNGAKSSLKLDPCRCWTIEGRKGNAYTWGDGQSWLLVVLETTVRKWNNLKASLQALPGTSLTQDGDEGGCFKFTALPGSHRHCETIRKAIGLRQSVDRSANLPSERQTSPYREAIPA